ncbi:MAG: hypothetical protein RBT76_14965 [candidate division Zixibacteria bacterium]|jgi:hypothetical protein|nr:hypothetical protein [candidate division Zixibacteria bacterium]
MTGSAGSPVRRFIADPNDVGSIEAIITALYESVSFEPGSEPNWNRLRSLFLDSGRLIPRRPGALPEVQSMNIEGFITRSEPVLRAGQFLRRGFIEREITRRIERFGGIVHVWSTYQSSFADGGEPFTRGINSIQLVYHHDRWWVLTIFWEDETPNVPLPAEYLA